MLQDWGNSLADAWSMIWDRIVNFFPNVLGAFLILLIGWIVAVLLERLVDQLLRVIGVQGLSEKSKIEDALKKMNVKKDLSGLLAALVKWIVLIVVLLSAAQTLNLPTVADFFTRVLSYVPEVVSAAAILLIGVGLANFLSSVVDSVARGTDLGYADLIATLTKYAIIIFAFLAALVQLGVATVLIQTLFTGFVAFAAIAAGLAFGLGGQESARDFLDKLQKDISHKRK
jgi:hypothetical protein